MISIYKKYHIAYLCISYALMIGMVITMLVFWRNNWYYPFLITIPTIMLVIVNIIIFTRLALKKFNDEVITLFYNCQVHRFIDELNRLLENKTKGVILSFYNLLVARGYSVIDDYDSVYDYCQKIKAKAHKPEYHKIMIDYYLKNEQIDMVQKEIEELRKLIVQMKNAKNKEAAELSIKNAEFCIRIKQGNYDGAEEYFLKLLETEKPLYPILEASYTHALGKLLILKGNPERAKEYLHIACNIGGDTKYKKFAEELLQKIAAEQ